MPESHFSIANIPYGIASKVAGAAPSVVTRLFDQVIFLHDVAEAGLFADLDVTTAATFTEPTLNALASLDRTAHIALRRALQTLLADVSILPKSCIAHADSVVMHLPVFSRNFTDYLCSAAHILNAGKAMRGTAMPLPPSFTNVPIGYTGYSSSLIVSGTNFVRPKGLLKADKEGEFVCAPSARMDYELEVGVVIGKATARGEIVTSNNVADHIFGLVLVNDWSARDIQAVEMQPLGPHNGKSFATSVSPWVVTALALEPFTLASPPRRGQSNYIPETMTEHNTYDLHLSASVKSAVADSETVVCRSEFRGMDWTLRDLVMQQTANGCPIEVGDILGSGTVSGFEDGEGGCLLEINGGGSKEFKLKTGESRIWLEDGDSVVLSGWAGEGVGFGECVGSILPAL